MEGKEIAVWVYSNLDSVELLLNGKSLGSKDVKKDSHVAWNVSYVPGTIEARGYKDGKLAMTEKRETTGPAAKLVMKADRPTINADGEDVAMFAVEVRDAHDRVVPITENEVTFTVSGNGHLIGVGNGDPTNQESDKGTSRKAFSGLCMAIVQSTKAKGSITVRATSPGLAAASVTIDARQVTLRPQVEAWRREVPVGSGITGLWRPLPSEKAANGMLAFVVGNGTMVFTLHQSGSSLTGTVEGGGGFFSGGETPAPIEDGKVDGKNVSFKAGNSSYSGTISGDRLELQRKIEIPFREPHTETPAGPQPAIGPPPNGSDPSRNPSFHMPTDISVMLHRVER
jgi:beta-galactosidase